MNLTVDIGNTRTKWMLFDGDRPVEEGVGLPFPAADRTICCATGELPSDLRQSLPSNTLNFQLRSPNESDEPATLNCPHLPVAIDYLTPNTLGPDRVAAACGAWKRHGGEACVIVDAGTCITLDWLDGDGVYHGGAILPGLGMKFRALHTFTAKLPLLENEVPYPLPVTGRTTQESMQAGVLTATRYAVEGFVAHYRRQCPEAHLLLTGGDATRLQALGGILATDGEYEPNLVMIGLNEILKQND